MISPDARTAKSPDRVFGYSSHRRPRRRGPVGSRSLIENRRRSVAMLSPGAPALNLARGTGGAAATRRGATGGSRSATAARVLDLSVEPCRHVPPVVAPLPAERADAWQPFIRPTSDRLEADVQNRATSIPRSSSVSAGSSSRASSRARCQAATDRRREATDRRLSRSAARRSRSRRC